MTSVSHVQPSDTEMKKSLTTSSSSSMSENLLLNDNIKPKSILKKFNRQSSVDRIPLNQKRISSSLLSNAPKPIPRAYLKQFKQDESPF
jgi:hypothetical protein